MRLLHEIAGYRSREYAESFREFGEPLRLEQAGGWLIKRPIPGSSASDAMGCYPLFSCAEWSELGRDLAGLDSHLVAVSVVTDPFGGFELDSLRESFPDLVEPFKVHYAVDLPTADFSSLTKHHRYYVRRALKRLRIECADEPVAHVDEWQSLYATLVKRHGLSGIKAFSRSAFERQLSVPGTELLIAREDDEIVGAQIWYQDGDVIYSHLAAATERGYELSASYALHWSAIERFKDRARWLALGAGAGLDATAGAGLEAFKRGFATDTRMAYLCGRIGDRERYDELARAAAPVDAGYFPAYRAGELR